MRLSVELVPRSDADLKSDAAIATSFAQVDTLNIPDLLRFDLRSWTACAALRAQVQTPNLIPHIRSMDCAPDQPLPFDAAIREHGVRELVVVTGDMPQDMRKVWKVTPLQLAARIRREYPDFDLKIYGALDTHRHSFREELDYAQEKRDAGFDGFFTQPLFDVREAEMYGEHFEDTPIFWGVAPVIADSSRRYWENKNNVVFPKGFEPTFAWNVQFGKDLLQWLERTGNPNWHCYLMPIRVSVQEYLDGVFG